MKHSWVKEDIQRRVRLQQGVGPFKVVTVQRSWGAQHILRDSGGIAITPCTLVGDSKQRRQQRRAIERYANSLQTVCTPTGRISVPSPQPQRIASSSRSYQRPTIKIGGVDTLEIRTISGQIYDINKGNLEVFLGNKGSPADE